MSERDSTHALPQGEGILRATDLVIGYGGRGLLPPISFEVRRGSFVAVIGRNGSGKSTFFKTALGLQAPVSGAIERIPPGLRCAYVPQTSSIDPLLPLRGVDLTAWGRLSGWNFLRPFASGEDRSATQNALASTQAIELGGRRFREMSEGQRQRILLSRILATRAELVFLDEPTAAMDVVAEREMVEQLAALVKSHGLSVVIVSHDLSVAFERADTILFLDGEGPEVIVGDSKHVFSHPTFVKRYGVKPRLGHHIPGELCEHEHL